METDFGAQVAGGGIGTDPAGFFSQYFSWFGANTWGWVVIAIMIVLMVLVIAFFFGWIGTAAVKNKDGFNAAWGTSFSGNTNPLYKISRDGSGESMSNLEMGYAANPDSFCEGAGEPTDDPWEFMRAGAESKESFSSALGSRSDPMSYMDADNAARMAGLL